MFLRLITSRLKRFLPWVGFGLLGQRSGAAFQRWYGTTDPGLQSVVNAVGCHTSDQIYSKQTPVTRLSQSAEQWRNLQLHAFFLREPRARTLQILGNNQKFLAQVERRRNSVLSPAALSKHQSQFYIPQLSAFKELVDYDRRSRIVATYHFGDFVYGLNELMCHEVAGRKRLLYSQERASSAYFHNVRLAFGARGVAADGQLTADQTSPLALLDSLRQGHCTLVMFCDLPQNFGATVAVKFLGRQARFPRGPALLAVTAGVPVLPVICYQHAGQHRVHFGKYLEASVTGSGSREVAVKRVAQSLCALLEEFLARFPAQWRYLRQLPGYFIEPGGDACRPPSPKENSDDTGCLLRGQQGAG